MAERLLRLPEVMRRVPYSRAAIYQKMKAGEFPKQISLGGRAVAWVESEINEWIAECVKRANFAGPVEIEREVDGRWIAEATGCPGAMAYGKTAREAKYNALGIVETCFGKGPGAGSI